MLKVWKESVTTFGCPAQKIVVTAVGLCARRFPYRDRTLVPGDVVRILPFPRLVEKKGLEYSIQAVSRLVHKYPAVQYEIIGEGPLRARLRCLMEKLGLANTVFLRGAKAEPEVQQAMERAHIFVAPSITASTGDTESLCGVLVEARAIGLPVVSSLHAGMPEAVRGGESAFLVPERDTEALAERLLCLVEDPASWPMSRQSSTSATVSPCLRAAADVSPFRMRKTSASRRLAVRPWMGSRFSSAIVRLLARDWTMSCRWTQL